MVAERKTPDAGAPKLRKQNVFKSLESDFFFFLTSARQLPTVYSIKKIHNSSSFSSLYTSFSFFASSPLVYSLYRGFSEFIGGPVILPPLQKVLFEENLLNHKYLLKAFMNISHPSQTLHEEEDMSSLT